MAVQRTLWLGDRDVGVLTGAVNLVVQSIEPPVGESELDVLSGLITHLAATLTLRTALNSATQPLGALRSVWNRLGLLQVRLTPER